LVWYKTFHSHPPSSRAFFSINNSVDDTNKITHLKTCPLSRPLNSRFSASATRQPKTLSKSQIKRCHKNPCSLLCASNSRATIRFPLRLAELFIPLFCPFLCHFYNGLHFIRIFWNGIIHDGEGWHSWVVCRYTHIWIYPSLENSSRTSSWSSYS